VAVRPLQGPLPRDAGCRLGLLGRGAHGDLHPFSLFCLSPLQRAYDGCLGRAQTGISRPLKRAL